MSEEQGPSVFEIPIGDAISKFHDHLKNHERTIFSAKFGDGKSYFLQKFMATEEVKKSYVFLTLYPVNYQVEENRDVFELIKYDLLIQLFVHKVMEPDFKMSKRQALEWCIQLNAPTLVEGLLPIFANLCMDETSARMMAALLTAKKSIGKIKRKAHELMEPVRDKQIEQFFKELSKNPVAGLDVITEIIQKGIADYKKEHPDKELVLIVEDLDRMDPAHLFRILNVFSAHIDYNYRFVDNANHPYVGNKFGLDKVVFVMCYDNTKNIFHHFYGMETAFEGYINKFCSSNFFHYSFSEEKEKFLYERMVNNTKMDPATIRYIIKPELLKKHSIREIVNAIENLDGFVKPIDTRDKMNQPIMIHYGGMKAIAILRRLGLSDEELKETISTCLEDKKNYKMVLSYLACPLSIATRGRLFNNKIPFRNPMGGESTVFEIDRLDDSGKAVCQYYIDRTGGYDNKTYFLKALDKLLGMLSA